MQLYRYKWCWTLRLPKFGGCPRKHQNLHQLILADHKLKLREIAEELKISEASVFTILHDQWKSCVQSGCCSWSKTIMRRRFRALFATVSMQQKGVFALICDNYLGKRKTINNEYYIALLVCLKEEIAIKQPEMKKKVLFHQDNAPCPKSIVTMAKLHELHPPYFPDLAPSNNLLFPYLKRMLQGKRFGSN